MIITITLNPCIDKSTVVDEFQPEIKMRCKEVKNEAGGGGINVSKALKRLEANPIALFPAGGHNGEMLKTLLNKENISFHSIATRAETRENWIVLETNTNKQYRFTFPGKEIDEQAIHDLLDDLQSFAPSFVVASGSLPPQLPPLFYGLIVEKTKALNAKCVVDTSGDALKALEGRNAFMIKPNVGELCKILGIERLEKNEVDDAALQLIENNYAENVVVSMGAEGAWLVNKTEKHFVAAPQVKKISTVGAGDSMVAGIIYMLQKESSLKKAIKFGVACGSAATMNAGTELFHKEDVYKIYGKIN